MEFAFSNKRWLTVEELNQEEISNEQDVLGFHPQGAFDKIIDIEHCWLQGTPSNELRNAMREIAIAQELEFFDVRAQKGFLRHMIVRTSSLNQTLLIVSFYQDDRERRERYLDAVIEKFPEVTTVIYTINSKSNDYLLDLEMITYSGKGYIEEELGHVRFRVGPKSFFQTNSSQAVTLFDTVVKFAGLDGTQNVYDLYSGVGSIALYLAKYCKHVTGVEEIAAAIEDAKLNAQLNGIENSTFYAGDVKDILTDEFTERHGAPDLVITDPPRAGMHPKVIDIFRELKAPKIVYVSCNPATQARDLQLLSDLYRVRKSAACRYVSPYTPYRKCGFIGAEVMESSSGPSLIKGRARRGLRIGRVKITASMSLNLQLIPSRHYVRFLGIFPAHFQQKKPLRWLEGFH